MPAPCRWPSLGRQLPFAAPPSSATLGPQLLSEKSLPRTPTHLGCAHGHPKGLRFICIWRRICFCRASPRLRQPDKTFAYEDVVAVLRRIYLSSDQWEYWTGTSSNIQTREDIRMLGQNVFSFSIMAHQFDLFTTEISSDKDLLECFRSSAFIYREIDCLKKWYFKYLTWGWRSLVMLK